MVQFQSSASVVVEKCEELNTNVSVIMQISSHKSRGRGCVAMLIYNVGTGKHEKWF